MLTTKYKISLSDYVSSYSVFDKNYDPTKGNILSKLKILLL